MAKDNKNHGKLLLDNGKVIVMWVCIFYKNTLFFILLFFFVAVYLFRFALSFFQMCLFTENHIPIFPTRIIQMILVFQTYF